MEFLCAKVPNTIVLPYAKCIVVFFQIINALRRSKLKRRYPQIFFSTLYHVHYIIYMEPILCVSIQWTRELESVESQEQQKLTDENQLLGRRVRDALDQRTKGRQGFLRDRSKLDGAEKRFRAALKQWPELLAEKERAESHYRAMLMNLKCT